MKTGKLGLKLSFLAVLIYLVCYFGSIEALLILCGFLILHEKDEWLNIQAFQAMLLKCIYYLAYILTTNIYSWLTKYPLGDSSTSSFLEDASHVHDTLIFAYDILLLIAILIAASGAGKGENVNIPFISGIVKKMMSITAFEEKISHNTQLTEALNGKIIEVKKHEDDVWYCSQCGSRNTTDFCVKCGTKKRTN